MSLWLTRLRLPRPPHQKKKASRVNDWPRTPRLELEVLEDQPTERWLPIPGWEGLYDVSDFGQVRSLDRRRVDNRQAVHGRILKGSPTRVGYPAVHLRRGGQTRQFSIHVLVLEVFVGPRPSGFYGCHNNGDRTDNRLANLRWDTPASNSHDQITHGTNHAANKTHCPRGHLLESPNIVAYESARGHRACKACARARAHAHHRGIAFSPFLADRKYREILAEGRRAAEDADIWAVKRTMRDAKLGVVA